MSIERKRGSGFTVQCDGPRCHEFLEVESPDLSWTELIEEMDRAKWLRRKDDDDDWHHFCSAECARGAGQG